MEVSIKFDIRSSAYCDEDGKLDAGAVGETVIEIGRRMQRTALKEIGRNVNIRDEDDTLVGSWFVGELRKPKVAICIVVEGGCPRAVCADTDAFDIDADTLDRDNLNEPDIEWHGVARADADGDLIDRDAWEEAMFKQLNKEYPIVGTGRTATFA